MAYLRNREIKWEILIFAALWCGGCVLGAVTAGPLGAASAVLTGFLFLFFHFFLSYRRYRRIA